MNLTLTIRLACSLLVSLATPMALAGNVTFTGSDTGPFNGSFQSGTVTATATGSDIVAGDLLAALPNSALFPFDTNQTIRITDRDLGAAISFVFTSATFGPNDYFFISNLAGESNVVLQAKKSGIEVDADWSIAESVGESLVFDDDGAGLNATLSGIPNVAGGVLLQASLSGIEELVISWTGGWSWEPRLTLWINSDSRTGNAFNSVAWLCNGDASQASLIPNDGPNRQSLRCWHATTPASRER